MRCDGCGIESERRVRPGFLRVSPEVTARRQAERRAFLVLCAPCCTRANAGHVIGVRAWEETQDRAARCVECQQTVTVRDTYLCALKPGAVVVRHLRESVALEACACREYPAATAVA